MVLKVINTSIGISKYHGLGNDYLVVEQQSVPAEIPLAEMARIVCCHHYGMGADGLLVNCSNNQQLAVRIFNPDGSEAEKSGNGLRIFTRYLYDLTRIALEEVTINTATDKVSCRIIKAATAAANATNQVRVVMGKVVFADGAEKPLAEQITIDQRELTCYRANIGNPHCVILVKQAIDNHQLENLGRQIEKLPMFPDRTNVQFLRAIDKSTIAIQIWERGAGITLASGSSSSAAAAVAHRLGWCDNQVKVVMPGGELAIEIDAENQVTMQGEVTKVFSGVFSPEALAYKQPVAAIKNQQ